ncbi:MAG: TetR/AcrR family transcriptional regulator [Pseudomonadota bacterium]
MKTSTAKRGTKAKTRDSRSAKHGAKRAANPRPLDRELVLSTALAVVRDEGFDKLTMRRLAGELGVTPMAIYNYFGNQDILNQAMVDAIVGDVLDEVSRQTGSWRKRIQHMLETSLKHCREYPGMSQLFWSGGNDPWYRGKAEETMSNSLRLADLMFACLEEGGFSKKQAVYVSRTLVLLTLSAGERGNSGFEPDRFSDEEQRELATEAPHFTRHYNQYQALSDESIIRAGIGLVLDGAISAYRSDD